ncbi:MAG: hypothetical protein LWW92_12675 [Rhodocyclales bacterium]|nr:hypothetical protein [Rhodocyclales bacterium]
MSAYQTWRLSLRPLSAFGTPLAGDTLFGQLCWVLRHLHGEAQLNTWLEGYPRGHPFLVLSDAFPQGHIPLPHLPRQAWAPSDADRKQLKQKRWLPLAALDQPLPRWQALAQSEAECLSAITGRPGAQKRDIPQPHNTINRLTGTTGEDQFAPYTRGQIWFPPGMVFDLYVVLDSARIHLEQLLAALTSLGLTGYGRDASIGLGRFELQSPPLNTNTNLNPFPPAAPEQARLTLGPCAPQGQGYCPLRSYYQPITRFGRHGDVAAYGPAFKRPLLLAQAGAVLHPGAHTPASPWHGFVGQGLGGVGQPISSTLPATVHQGYAPALGLPPVEIAA